MLSLAIECSGLHGSVAVLRDSEMLDSTSLPTNRSSVQTLSQTIANILKPLGAKPDFLSVTSGPGSFTGLRVGLTTAKMLGFAWRVPIVPVDTLAVIAHEMNCRLEFAPNTILVPVMNAFRRQVFTAAWQVESNETIVPLSPSEVVDAEVWKARNWRRETGVKGSLKTIAVGGPGLEQYQPLASYDSSDSDFVVLDGVVPTASWVARIGATQFAIGKFTTATDLAANYIRPSAAEEKSKE